MGPSGSPSLSGEQEDGHPKQPASQPPAAGAVRPAMHPPEGGESSHFYLKILRLKFAVPNAPTRRTQSGSSCTAPPASPSDPKSTNVLTLTPVIHLLFHCQLFVLT